MSAVLKPHMNVDDFFAWADGQEGKFELDDGQVVAMSPERVIHARAKFAIARALANAISRAGIPCEAFVEGLAVRIDQHTSYQPDVLVHCGTPLKDDERETRGAVIVVEVLSPFTAYRDLGRKLRNYFRVPSVRHYLVVDSDERQITHHQRGEGGTYVTRIVTEGTLVLDPPGVQVEAAELLPRSPTPPSTAAP